MKRYLVVYQTEKGTLGNAEMRIPKLMRKRDKHSELIDLMIERIRERNDFGETEKIIILNIISLNDIF